MHALEPTHSPTPEEIMEYLDGEGAAATRERISAHVAACTTCQAVIASQRELSRTAQTWMVTPAPASLRPPVTPAPSRLPVLQWLRQPRLAVVTFGGMAAVMIAIVMTVPAAKRAPRVAAVSRGEGVIAPEAPPPATSAGGVSGRAQLQQAQRATPIDALTLSLSAAQSPRTPSVIRTATLRVVVRDFTTVRESVEGIVAAANGFVDQMTVTGDASTARQLRGTLRVPGDRLADVLTRLRAIGTVIEDTQGSQDVTDQIVDLDARLASARATEKRLTELLQNRTGKLSDVLDVERELARVRLDIERLDAEKTNVGRRVAYATIDITISEERKASVDIGPLSLGRQLQLAALDGIENVIASAAGAVLFVLRVGPTLLLWGLVAAAVWLIWRRVRRSSRLTTGPAA